MLGVRDRYNIIDSHLKSYYWGCITIKNFILLLLLLTFT